MLTGRFLAKLLIAKYERGGFTMKKRNVAAAALLGFMALALAACG